MTSGLTLSGVRDEEQNGSRDAAPDQVGSGQEAREGTSMHRLWRHGAALGLGIALVVASAVALPAMASDDDNPSDVETSSNPDFTDPRVDGIIYKVTKGDKQALLVILDKDLGLGIEVLVVNPKALELVNNGTACTNRYVVAEGERTGPTSLTAHGLEVDVSRACGDPPK